MKIAILVTVLLLFLAAAGGVVLLGWNVWYAESHTPTVAAGAVDEGRAKLDGQLAASEKKEAEIEKQYWNDPIKLQKLVAAHQKRQDELAGNSTAQKITAHDGQAIARLQQRITALWIERKAQADAEAEAEKQAAIDARQQAIEERAAGQSTKAPVRP